MPHRQSTQTHRQAAKTGGKKKRKNFGFTFLGRGEYQKGGSALACGKAGKEAGTCLSDALFNCISAMGVAVEKEETLSIMPKEGGDANLYDAEQFVLSLGLVMVMRDDLMNAKGGPELALFNVISGFFVVCLKIYRDGKDTDNHALAFRADKGQLLDNYKYHKIPQLEPDDKESKEAARAVFMHNFKGASKIIITQIYEISAGAKRAKSL